MQEINHFRSLRNWNAAWLDQKKDLLALRFSIWEIY